MVNEWLWAIFSSFGTGIIMFVLGLIRSGIADIKGHLSRQDSEISVLGQRISKVEGKLNVGA